MDDISDADVEALYAGHGGDPRGLELGKCLLVSNLPSSFLSDSFEVFSECLHEMLSEEFNISREAMEKIIRVPKLQPDAESQEAALRAIVMFKSRVHKHRVFAQKKVTLDGSIGVSSLDEIPREMLETEDIEIADEVGDDDEQPLEDVGVKKEEPASAKASQEDALDLGDDEPIAEDEKPEGNNKAENGNGHSTVVDDKPDVKTVVKEKDVKPKKDSPKADKEKSEKTEPEVKKKAYVDEDLKVPFEIKWDGAPEFQWKLLSAPGDNRRMTLENLFRSDLQNPFIYRVMSKAETVDINFPMRFNLDGNKQMCGKMTLIFNNPTEIMQEAMNHLIYVRCSLGRRIKVYLPQTPFAVKQKEEFESRLGRVIEYTPRMHQLVVKVLPKDSGFTIEDAKIWFPDFAANITAFEIVDDEISQPCGIVTFDSVTTVMGVHSSYTFVTAKGSDDKEHKLHTFMRGVEAHFGSLMTRWDYRKRAALKEATRPATATKRPADKTTSSSSGSATKKSRGTVPTRGTPRGGFAPRGGRGGTRGGFTPRVESYSGGRGRGGSNSYNNRREPEAFLTPSPRTVGSNMRGGAPYDHMDNLRREVELQERMIRQQQLMENMRMERQLGREVFDRAPNSGGFGFQSGNGFDQGRDFDRNRSMNFDRRRGF